MALSCFADAPTILSQEKRSFPTLQAFSWRQHPELSLPSIIASLHPQDQIKATTDKITATLGIEFDAASSYTPQAKDWLASHWTGFRSPAQLSRIRNTGEGQREGDGVGMWMWMSKGRQQEVN